MNWSQFLPSVLVMAVVTYLIRMLPLAVLRKKVKSPFLRSFLYYVPYAVLSVMTFPAVFSCTGSVPTSVAGTAVALLLGFLELPLPAVAAAACLVSYLAGLCL